ncbi:MAG TPA: cupin domain-containing protein [Nitrososphaerales archaeon]|nr:cupin domain-containing protein [Nitrososphaerales archaeon]
MAFSKKSHRKPDERRKFGKGKVELVKVGNFTFGKGTFNAGWKWSKHVKPIAKTESCQVHHIGYVVSGRMAGVMDDGTKWRAGPGDVLDLPPGHDAWTVGKDPCVFLDITGFTEYAK